MVNCQTIVISQFYHLFIRYSKKLFAAFVISRAAAAAELDVAAITYFTMVRFQLFFSRLNSTSRTIKGCYLPILVVGRHK